MMGQVLRSGIALPLLTGALFCAGVKAPAWAQDVAPGEEAVARMAELGVTRPAPAPDRPAGEGEGPYPRLVIRGATLVDGSGAPPMGPVDIVIEQDRIAEIRSVGAPGVAIPPEGRPPAGDREIDVAGFTVLPGFIDAHAHIGNMLQGLTGEIPPPEYIFKLWLAHGVTTARELGAGMGLDWTLAHKRRAARGEITAPRLVVHAAFPNRFRTTDEARTWVKAVRKKGADGLKFFGAPPVIIAAAIDEAKRLGMKTAFHHAQTAVARVNALDSARMGLDSMEHWYGLPEALFEDRQVQDYPLDYNYNDEQHRFGAAGRLWRQAAAPGSAKWDAVIAELIGLDFTIDPTLTIYEANRDVMGARTAEWHADYSLPSLIRFFTPNRVLHGSYHFDWTTADEVAWRENFRLWMTFLNDFKNRGGRVTVGSDAGFIYKLFGFAYVRELELLQEAGFHPLEVLQAATMNGAYLLGLGDEVGTVEPGKKADLVLVPGNPLANFKRLYGTGHMKLNDESGRVERVGGVAYTIRDGIVWDARKLLADVRAMVAKAKAREASRQSAR
ncbi:MAG: amidohydrolase family protein [Pseudomonadota bacterium]